MISTTSLEAMKLLTVLMGMSGVAACLAFQSPVFTSSMGLRRASSAMGPQSVRKGIRFGGISAPKMVFGLDGGSVCLRPLCQTLGVLHGRETFLVCSLRFSICTLLHLCAFHPSSSLSVKEYSIPSCLEIPATMIFYVEIQLSERQSQEEISHAPLPTDRDGQV